MAHPRWAIDFQTLEVRLVGRELGKTFFPKLVAERPLPVTVHG